jgi:hypothetical protein
MADLPYHNLHQDLQQICWTAGYISDFAGCKMLVGLNETL